MSARKAHENTQVKIGSKRKVRFQEEQSQRESEEGVQGAQEGARPRSEWRPDQVTVAEGAKRQRTEEEDVNQRESENTGGKQSE